MIPTVSALALELYAALEPFNFDDEGLGWPHLLYCEALVGAVQPIAGLVRDSDDGPGWSPLVDVDRCPDFALPWLAQTNGTILTPGMDAAAQRAAIRDEPGFRRGTLGAIVTAAQKNLTDGKRVLVNERDGSAYKLTIRTFVSETPDEAQTLADITAQKPAGIVLDYGTIDGSDFDLVRLTYDTFDDLTAAFTDFQDLIDHGPTL